MNNLKDVIKVQKGRQYIDEAIGNSKQFLKDAKILIESGSFAHGAAIAVFAIEEAVKAKLMIKYIGRDGSLEIDYKTYENEIKNHFNKLAQAGEDHITNELLYRLMPEGRTSSCSLEELYDGIKKLLEDKNEKKCLKKINIDAYSYAGMTFLKMKWLYVDIEEGEVVSPLTLNKNDALEVLRLAEKRVSEYELDYNYIWTKGLKSSSVNLL